MLRSSLLVGAALSAFVACQLPGTGGETVEVQWRFRSAVETDGPVLVDTIGSDPWQVEILEAKLLLGPVYGFAPPRTAFRFSDLIGPSTAHAHAGDDNTLSERVVSELLNQVAVDLLDPAPRMLEPALAEAGPLASMNVLFDEARFDNATESGPTRGGHALLRGIARRGDDEVRFVAVLGETIPDDRIARRLESLPVGGELAEGSTIELRADPRAWVRQMRFDDFVGQEGEVFVEEPSQLHNAWYLGLRDPAGWDARVVD
ncbi:MAG: hypothetical protein AAGE52_30025 [Myxococcota bacterium]